MTAEQILIQAIKAALKEAGNQLGHDPDEPGTVNQMAYILRQALKQVEA